MAGSQVSPVGQVIENPVMHVSYYAHWDVRVDVLAACANLWRDDAQVYVVPDGRGLEGDPGLRESGMTHFRQQTCRALRYNQRAMSTGVSDPAAPHVSDDRGKWMIRLLLRPALALTALLTLSVVLMRAQPEDESVRLFLTPDADCAALCLLGMRPGATTVGQAMDLRSPPGPQRAERHR
jgi:hypothetical protein